jgi:manganese transport protein
VAVFGLVVLGLRIRGYEGIRPVLLTLFGLIVVLLVARVIVAGVDEPALVRGLVPQPLDGSAALLAVGFIGATVMPHALHFHSAVAREDSRPKDAASWPRQPARSERLPSPRPAPQWRASPSC